MKLAFIPEPQSIHYTKGTFLIPSTGIDIEIKKTSSHKLRQDGYRLQIQKNKIVAEVQSDSAINSCMHTMNQIIQQCDNTFPCLSITDSPDFPTRGIFYDVTRGRIPKLKELKKQIDLLAKYKINHFQLYIEHTFKFKGHPKISRGSSPLTESDIRKLDSYCKQRNIELVPGFASLSHMSRILQIKDYRHLAEDYGTGTYADPQAEELPAWQRRKGWSFAPANPKTYKFIDELFKELLPLFSSDKLNVCCDEAWDLGFGQSQKLCAKKGVGNLYLDHILKLRDIAKRYGKRIMFWGDIIRKHKELLDKIPEDVTILDWGYEHDFRFDNIKDFTNAGIKTYACPGTSSWASLFPRIHEAKANIHGFAESGKKHHASGMLITDWGDNGHYNFTEFSWYSYLFGAEQAWNNKADIKSFPKRFAKLFLNTQREETIAAIEELGNITHLNTGGYYQSIWQHIFFAEPDSSLFQQKRADAWTVAREKILKKKITINAQLGIETIDKLKLIRRVFNSEQKRKNSDPNDVLPYWIFSLDTLIHAARKLTVLCNDGGKNNSKNRLRLKNELERLMKRFEELWRNKNRPSEIRTTLKRYKSILKSLS